MSYQVSEIFSPYFKYCAEQTACQQYCKEQDRDNQVFKAYLAVSQVVVMLVMVMLVMVVVMVYVCTSDLTCNFSGVRLREIVIVSD